MPQNPPSTGSRHRQHAAAMVGNLHFRDPEGARKNLQYITGCISPSLAAMLPALIADSPDPDSALLQFERLLRGSADVAAQLGRQPVLAHYAVLIFGHSRFLGDTILRDPGRLAALLTEKQLNRSYSREDFHVALARFRSASAASDVALLLARFKRHEYVRIMLRDVLRIAPLAETTAEISALADVLIDAALREAESILERKYGQPFHRGPDGEPKATAFAILSLGKLGGNELNYCSDVDLLYVYEGGEAVAEACVSIREYFIHLAQAVTDLLSRMTAEGPVFRIDLRLRPQGRDGEVAVSLPHAQAYYQRTAQDWERQALIKVRHTAGDRALAREFIRSVQAGVYTPQINFAAIKTALVAREKMQGRLATGNSPSSINVKTGHGGIRDIEFLVQCLQRVYGGSEPWLRSRGTLFALQKLHDKGHISGTEFHELTTAYEFLRHLEHRLQLKHGQQTHRLPDAPEDIEVLRRSMDVYSTTGTEVANLRKVVKQRMEMVSAIYKRVIFQQQAREEEDTLETRFSLSLCTDATTADPATHLLRRLASDSPRLYALVTRSDLDAQARKNLLRLLISAFGSSERYALILDRSDAVETVVNILGISDFLAGILVHHPEEVITLAELQHSPQPAATEYLFDLPLGEHAAADPIFAYLTTSPATHNEKLALLRRHYHHRIFAEGVRDLLRPRDVYSSLTSLTAIADDAISTALGIIGPARGLAVLGLGRMGTGEHDLCSDVDLLFVCAAECDESALRRSAERLIHALAAYTQDGTVFPVDTRLRPRGAEGELVLTIPQFEAYLAREAQPWEALVHTKARFLAGDRQVGELALRATRTLFERFASDPGFGASVAEMRAKLEANAHPSFKSSAGAFYDIDFIAGWLLVTHSIPEKRGSIRNRLWRCAEAGVLAKRDAATLDHAAELLRTTDHAVRLVTGRSCTWLPAAEQAKMVTCTLVSKMLRRTCPDALEEELVATQREVRTIYEQVLGIAKT